MTNRLLFLLVFMCSLCAGATEYSSMKFTLNSGETYCIGLDGLEVTFDQGSLTARCVDDQVVYTIADVASMQFSTESPAGIDEITVDKPLTAYTTSGIECGNYESLDKATGSLPAGIYVMRFKDGSTIKISIKR